MCILPNFKEGHLEELKRNGNRKIRENRAKTVEIIFPEQPPLEKQI